MIGRGVDPNAPVIGTATAAGVAEDRMAAGADIAVEEELSGPDPLANIPVTDEMVGSRVNRCYDKMVRGCRVVR